MWRPQLSVYAGIEEEASDRCNRCPSHSEFGVFLWVGFEAGKMIGNEVWLFGKFG